MNRQIYRKIARKHNISVDEVKREMQIAVDQAFVEPTDFAKKIAGKGEKPSVDEFIEQLVREIQS